MKKSLTIGGLLVAGVGVTSYAIKRHQEQKASNSLHQLINQLFAQLPDHPHQYLGFVKSFDSDQLIYYIGFNFKSDDQFITYEYHVDPNTLAVIHQDVITLESGN